MPPDTKVLVTLGPLARESGFEFESLFAFSSPDGLFQIASVPAFAFNLNVGDVVACSSAPDGSLAVTSVVRRSGSATLRFWVPPTFPPLALTSILATLRSSGGLVEPFGQGAWGLSVPSLADLSSAIEVICANDPEAHIGYSAGFAETEPFFDPVLLPDDYDA